MGAARWARERRTHANDATHMLRPIPMHLLTGVHPFLYERRSFAGCNVESTSVDLSVGAERTTVLKAVSEGETRFRSMAMASDTDLGFPSPDGPGRQFLAEFGEFPVYLVNRDMQVR